MYFTTVFFVNSKSRVDLDTCKFSNSRLVGFLDPSESQFLCPETRKPGNRLLVGESTNFN